MAILQHLSTIALHQMLGDGADAVVHLLLNRFSDQSQRLIKTLASAAERAWKALEVALARDTWWDRLEACRGPREDQALARQVRAFLDALPALPNGDEPFRQQCLRELRDARARGLLAGALDASALARQFGALSSATPQIVVQAQWQTLRGAGGELRQANYSRLAWLVEQQPQTGQPLLALAVRYFFRRPVLVSCPHCQRRLSVSAVQAASGPLSCPHYSGSFVLSQPKRR